MNSVNTNIGAMVALQSLNRTTDQLDTTQKRVSTGFRVADAKDDGAAFAVAQRVRADVSGLTSAQEQLGGVKGIVDVTLAALTKVSKTMEDIKAVVVKLADGNIDAATRTQYAAQYQSLQQSVVSFISDATYNGNTLLTAASTTLTTVRNETGGNYSIGSILTAGITITATAPATVAAASTMLSGSAATDFNGVMGAINTALNTMGNHAKYVDRLREYNKDKIDALESGLGALVDADLAKESAKMQSLQVRQQLGTQALGMANQAPQALLGLFR
ncbi:MAG TPA: flagellin [Acetobacteraceae bacterium]|jgi:flagellin|nr:flagellin [Acetobacteraceae bacterium]